MLAGCGLLLTNQTAAIIRLSVVVLGFFGWTQTSPADKPGLHEDPMYDVIPGEVVSNATALPPVGEPSPYTPPSVQP